MVTEVFKSRLVYDNYKGMSSDLSQVKAALETSWISLIWIVENVSRTVPTLLCITLFEMSDHGRR